MKRFIFMRGIFLTVIMVLLLPFESMAEVKIGYVDLNRALNESKRGKDAKAELEALVRNKQASIDELENKINEMRQEYDKQAQALSESAKKAKEEEIENAIRNYQKVVGEAQAEVEKKRKELTSRIINELKEVIARIAEEEGFTIILESSDGLILYSKKGLDLTDKVIKRYDSAKK